MSAWPQVALGEVLADATSGFACGEDVEGGVFQFRMNNITTEGQLDLSKQRRVPRDYRNIDRFLVQPGDVLFNATNSPDLVGKTAFFPGLEEPAVFSNHFLRLRPRDSQIDGRYLARWLNLQFLHGRFKGMCRQWVNQATVTRDALLSLKLPLPPLPEQRRIAAILDKADALRAKRRAALAQLDTLTQSIFLDMFGDPATNPKGYVTRSLTTVCNCYSGGTPSKRESRYWTGGLPWFSPKDLKQDDLFDSEDHINELVLSETSLKLLPANTVVVVVRGMILAHTFPVSVIRVPATINQDLKALLPKASIELDAQFLAHCLRAQSHAVLASVSESAHGTKRLDAEALAKIAVALPPFKLQQEFARRVAKAEESKAALRASLRQLDSLFASLQERAFRGDMMAITEGEAHRVTGRWKDT